MSPGARVSIVVLFALMLAIGAANILFTTSQVHHLATVVQRQEQQAAQLRAQQLAACAFARDLATVPLPEKPRPSKLGISLVTDSRAQWHGLHCPGTLPVPRGLAKWARFYHVPVN